MASTSFTMTIMPSNFQQSKSFSVRSCNKKLTHFCPSATSVDVFNNETTRLLLSCNPHTKRHQHVLKPISAVDSGLEVSITDPEDLITVKDAKIVVESQDENKIQVRVDLTGDSTQIVFDKVLANLARSAPPIPGFRREKGVSDASLQGIVYSVDIWSPVPKSFLLQVLGEDRVTKFVVQEIVSSTMTDYSKKENLSVKEKKVTTTQTGEELKKLFVPGNEFGFNAIMEFEKPEAEERSDDEEESETEMSSSSSDA